MATLQIITAFALMYIVNKTLPVLKKKKGIENGKNFWQNIITFMGSYFVSMLLFGLIFGFQNVHF